MTDTVSVISSAGDLLVFIHGFNVSFRDSLIRTAQLAYDLGFQGKPIAYSWPSQNQLDLYSVDETNSAVTVDHLVGFLEDLLRVQGVKRIHLVAHSMGAAALLEALARIDAKNPTATSRFSHVVLAAPDVDVDRFKQIQRAARARGTSVTLYVSSQDWALYISRRHYHRYQRLGDARPSPIVVAGVDTIDASRVETDFVGHSYYTGDTSIVGDLFYLINQDLRAPRRNLGTAGKPPASYFVFPK